MPVSVSWYLEDRVIREVFTGDITLKDIEAASTQTAAMLDSTDTSLVHLLQDYSGVSSFPRSVNDMNRMVEPLYTHDRLGRVMAYGLSDSAMQFTATMLGQLFQIRYRVMDTEADALDWLQEMDSTLPPLHSI